MGPPIVGSPTVFPSWPYPLVWPLPYAAYLGLRPRVAHGDPMLGMYPWHCIIIFYFNVFEPNSDIVAVL